MKHTLVAALVGGALATGGVAAAQERPADAEPRAQQRAKHGGHGAHAGPGAMLLPGMHANSLVRLADELGLTPEQRQTIKGFYDQARPGFEQLRERMRANTRLLMETQPDDPRYQAVVQQVSQSSAELATQMVLQSSQLRSEVHAVLTSEQRQRLAQIQSERRERMQERMQKRQQMQQQRRGGAATGA